MARESAAPVCGMGLLPENPRPQPPAVRAVQSKHGHVVLIKAWDVCFLDRSRAAGSDSFLATRGRQRGLRGRAVAALLAGSFTRLG